VKNLEKTIFLINFFVSNNRIFRALLGVFMEFKVLVILAFRKKSKLIYNEKFIESSVIFDFFVGNDHAK